MCVFKISDVQINIKILTIHYLLKVFGKRQTYFDSENKFSINPLAKIYQSILAFFKTRNTSSLFKTKGGGGNCVFFLF